MFRSIPRRTSSVRPMCWNDFVTFSTKTSASATVTSLVPDSVDWTQAARGNRWIDRGEDGDQDGGNGDEYVVAPVHFDGEPIHVVDVRIEPHAEAPEPETEHEPG